MPTTCVFQLDRINRVYSSGETINGRILLKTDKATRVNAVYVTLEGEAKVQWSLSGKGEGVNYTYFGHQQYLRTRRNVFSSTVFRAGTHVYALTLQIPPECPTSCRGPYGYIAYNISLIIDKPWSFDEIFRQPIGVVQTLDLNLYPEYALPLKEENVKFFCHWPCTSGPICSTLVLPFCGFVPMQDLIYYLEVDNQSPHYDVISIEASLKQHFVFLARKPLKRNYFTKTMGKNCLNERTLRLTKRLYEGRLTVPADLPRSTLNTNYIVFIHYTLQVKLKTGYFHYDTDISVPLVIGTVPLQQQQQERNIAAITTQPTLRSRHLQRQQQQHQQQEQQQTQQHENGTDSEATHLDENEVVRQELSDDDPPTYDSCLPPSFSYATLGSQQTLDHASCSGTPVRSKCNERQRINVQLPHFPGYSTFISTAPQAQQEQIDSGFDMRLFNSSDSVNTQRTGNSLETFGSDFILYETDEWAVVEHDL